MRAVTSGDIHLLARHLAGFRRAERGAAALRILEQAHVADSYRKRMGKAHGFWGDGSLAAATPRSVLVGAGPAVLDLPHLEAMGNALEAILRWKQMNCLRSGFSAPGNDPMFGEQGHGRSTW